MRGTQREKIVGTTSWEELLNVEIVEETKWSKDHRTLEQLRELRRLSGLSHGETSVLKWVNKLMTEQKIRRDIGRKKGVNGFLSRDVRYIFLK